jgi:hypothetical protein
VAGDEKFRDTAAGGRKAARPERVRREQPRRDTRSSRSTYLLDKGGTPAPSSNAFRAASNPRSLAIKRDRPAARVLVENRRAAATSASGLARGGS